MFMITHFHLTILPSKHNNLIFGQICLQRKNIMHTCLKKNYIGEKIEIK